jgi:chromosome partitioning protein
MVTLAIISQKGGSGKSTIAVHLAYCAVQHNLNTAIIDLDPQASAYDWNMSRKPEVRLDATKADVTQLSKYLKQAQAGGIDIAIIDTAPHSNPVAAIAAQLSTLVLIPCRPARFDLNAITSTIEIARLAKVPAAVVINAAPRGKMADEAKGVLEHQGITVLDTVLYQRAAYSHAVIDGRSVHEYEPDGKAAAEIDELYNHITRLYSNTR